MTRTKTIKVTVDGQSRRVRATTAYGVYATLPCPCCHQKRLALIVRESLSQPFGLACHECGNVLKQDAA